MKNTGAPLQPGVYYHIYNRGNNRENLFIEKRNYLYFLNLYAKHIEPVAATYAYCLWAHLTSKPWSSTSTIIHRNTAS